MIARSYKVYLLQVRLSNVTLTSCYPFDYTLAYFFRFPNFCLCEDLEFEKADIDPLRETRRVDCRVLLWSTTLFEIVFKIDSFFYAYSF